MHRAGTAADHPPAPPHGLTWCSPSAASGADEGPRLRSIRLARWPTPPATPPPRSPGPRPAREDHWVEAAAANSSGGLQATFFAELADESGDHRSTASRVGLIGAYVNESGIVNLVGLWSAPATETSAWRQRSLAAVADWAATIGADRLRHVGGRAQRVRQGLLPERGLRAHRRHHPLRAGPAPQPGRRWSAQSEAAGPIPSAAMDFELSEELARAAGDLPPHRPGQGQAPGAGDRRERGVPAGPLRGVPRRRAARPLHPRGRWAGRVPGILGLTIAIEEVAKY